MDNKDKQASRTTRDISTQLEEENLWDLEDDWDDEGQAEKQTTSESQDSQETEIPPEQEQEIAEESAEPEGKPEVEPEKQPEISTEQPAAEEKNTDPEPADSEPEDELDEDTEQPELALDEKPKSTAPISLQESSEETKEQSRTSEADSVEPSEEDDAAPTEAVGGITAPATVVLKKLSLNKTEKITLSALALVLIGCIIWGCIWLGGKNEIANAREAVELPVAGKFATISNLTTIWVNAKEETGINLNAVVVPSVSITLDPDKTGNGALRLYFQNADETSIGDTITLPFEKGQFSNGSNTIEVSASDGFHEEGQYYAYQAEDAIPWRVLILEAPSESSPGSEFIELLNAPVDAKRK
ncbi:MAG: hypothetical protein AB8F34_03460 [Akkermansiaceae bacterium]